MRGKLQVILVHAITCMWLLGCNDARGTKDSQIAQAAAQVKAIDPELQDALGLAIAGLAEKHAKDWVKVGKLWRGDLQARERRAFLTVIVYGHCYRFIAVGGMGLQDLDLVLLDPNGVETQRDVTQSETAVLGVESSICPNDPGAYRIEARARSGAGPFAIALYRDQR